MKSAAKKCSIAAIIAAIYASLTLFISPLSYGAMQVRVSEVLLSFALLTPSAIPGLTIGCFLANVLGPNGIIDAIVGSAATLLGSFLAYKFRKLNPFLALLPNILINGAAVGLELSVIFSTGNSFLYCFAWVALGEALACYLFAIPLYKFLKKRGDLFL